MYFHSDNLKSSWLLTTVYFIYPSRESLPMNHTFIATVGVMQPVNGFELLQGSILKPETNKEQNYGKN